jgi:hypothetical protein
MSFKNFMTVQVNEIKNRVIHKKQSLSGKENSPLSTFYFRQLKFVVDIRYSP